MALDVEDGTGKTTSEAYESVVNADAYITSHTTSNAPLAWPDNYGDLEKEVALRIGAQHLDQEYRYRLQGRRRTKAQALDWPRINVTIADGDFTIDHDEIPEDLKRANIHAALAYSSGIGLNPDKTDPGRVKSEMVKVGPITVDTEWSGSKDDETEYSMIDRLMSRYLMRGNRVIRA